MAEPTKKKPLEGQIKLPADLDHEIAQEAARRKLYKYELIQELWDNRAGAPQRPTPAQIGELTEQQSATLLKILGAKKGQPGCCIRETILLMVNSMMS